MKRCMDSWGIRRLTRRGNTQRAIFRSREISEEISQIRKRVDINRTYAGDF